MPELLKDKDIKEMKTPSRYSLLKTFSIIGICLMLILAAILGTIITSSIKQSKLNEVKLATADFVQRSTQHHLSREIFLSNDYANNSKTFSEFFHELDTREIVRIKVWDTHSRVIYSDEPELIGRSFPSAEGYVEALKGEVAAEIMEPLTDEHASEKGYLQLMEIYAPVWFDGTGDIAGIVEVYYSLDEMNAAIAKLRKIVWSILFIGFALFYTTIYFLVWRMSISLFEQQSRLVQARNELEQRSSDLEREILKEKEEIGKNMEELEQHKTAMLNIMEDVDDTNRQLINAQEKLKRNVEDLKRLDIQKDQFISITAHELKTPLTSIRGFSDLLMKDTIADNPPLRKKYLEIIFKDSKRLGDLISNILDLSRMDIGTLKMVWEEIPVASLIEEVKEQMDILIKEKGLESEFSVEEGMLPLTIDKGRIIQVISNLINNAVHYTEKGKIAVRVKRSGEDALFSVSDTGIGIPSEYVGKLFTRFYQVDNPMTRKIGGTGLGLSLCKGFVEAMGGKIWVESKVGEGSTFFFTLPLRQTRAGKGEITLFGNVVHEHQSAQLTQSAQLNQSAQSAAHEKATGESQPTDASSLHAQLHDRLHGQIQGNPIQGIQENQNER